MPEYQIQLDRQAYLKLDRFFTGYPKEAKKLFTAEFKKEAKAIVAAMRASSFSHTSGQSVGPGPGLPPGRRHLRDALQPTGMFAGGEKRNVGGFVRIDYGDKKIASCPAYIGRFQEKGTGHGAVRATTRGMQGRALIARAPIEHGFELHKNRFQIIVEQCIEKLMNRN